MSESGGRQTLKVGNARAVLLCVALCVFLCTGHFVMVSLNLSCLHCLQPYFFEHHFNLYLHIATDADFSTCHCIN